MTKETEGRVSPLSEIDGPLADRLVERLVDRFLADAGLSVSRRDQAIAQTEILVRVFERDNVTELDFTLPLSSGHPGGYTWDGAVGTAERLRTTQPIEGSRTCSGAERARTRTGSLCVHE